MKRIMLTVAYDGTAYNGWAYQPGKNVTTIEGVLNRAISGLTGERIEVIGASRTDAGVHAYGNLAVFDTASTIPPDKFIYAVNDRLPADIRIMKSQSVSSDFHPRHCNTLKTYEYRILNSRCRIPTERLYSFFCDYDLNEEAMNEACLFLEGEHDFTSFCSINSQSLTRERTITKALVSRCGDLITIRITGNGFLYNMVRIIAGTLIEVGRGKKAPSEIKEILAAKDRARAGMTAPANGLFLMEYSFIEGLPDITETVEHNL